MSLQKPLKFTSKSALGRVPPMLHADVISEGKYESML